MRRHEQVFVLSGHCSRHCSCHCSHCRRIHCRKARLRTIRVPPSRIARTGLQIFRGCERFSADFSRLRTIFRRKCDGNGSKIVRNRTFSAAAQRLGGSAPQRLGGSAPQRLGGSAPQRLGGSAPRRLSVSKRQMFKIVRNLIFSAAEGRLLGFARDLEGCSRRMQRCVANLG